MADNTETRTVVRRVRIPDVIIRQIVQHEGGFSNLFDLWFQMRSNGKKPDKTITLWKPPDETSKMVALHMRPAQWEYLMQTRSCCRRKITAAVIVTAMLCEYNVMIGREPYGMQTRMNNSAEGVSL